MTIKNDNRLDDLIAKARKLGEAEGLGVNSRIELAAKVVFAAADGVIEPTPAKGGDSDVQRIWATYSKARAQRAGDNRAADEGSVSSYKVQCSKLNAFAKFGKVKTFDPVEQLQLAREVFASIEDAKGSTFDAMLVYLRAQSKSSIAMTRDEIAGLFEPQVKDAKTALEQYEALYKSMESIAKGSQDTETSMGRKPAPSAELTAAMEQIGSAIVRLKAAEQRADDATFAKAAANLVATADEDHDEIPVEPIEDEPAPVEDAPIDIDALLDADDDVPEQMTEETAPTHAEHDVPPPPPVAAPAPLKPKGKGKAKQEDAAPAEPATVSLDDALASFLEGN